MGMKNYNMMDKSIIANAKTFDEKYIVSKTQNIFCASEILIYDYLIMKSIATDGLTSVVVGSSVVIGGIAYNELRFISDSMQYRISLSGFADKCQKTFNNCIKFKNKSNIYFISPEKCTDFVRRGINIDLLYITNPAVKAMFYHSNINVLYPVMRQHPYKGRIIYNFSL